MARDLEWKKGTVLKKCQVAFGISAFRDGCKLEMPIALCITCILCGDKLFVVVLLV